MIKVGYSSVNESSDYEDFKKKCQANPTYKKAASIAKKYGYRLAELCYVELSKSGKPYVRFNVAAINRNDYHPEIFYSSSFGKDPEFTIQTTSYGSMSLKEHAKFIDNVTDAHKMVAELSKLDLTTLESTRMDESVGLSESLEDTLNKITSLLDKEGIDYSFRGRRKDWLLVSKKDLKRASELARTIDKDYEITISSQA